MSESISFSPSLGLFFKYFEDILKYCIDLDEDSWETWRGREPEDLQVYQQQYSRQISFEEYA